MDVSQDGNSDKRRILNEISRCLKTIFVESSSSNNSSVSLALNCPFIQCVDRSLQHGLLNLLNGYWPLARNCSHAQTLQTIDNLAGLESTQRSKGKAWLLATLVEGSFLSYLQCFLSESQIIEQMYAPHAILRDPASLSQLCSLLMGIESVTFIVKETPDTIHEPSNYSYVEESASALVKPMLDLSLNKGNGTTMTSSMTSSLASPGDSGFTQLDSETDTASFSEIVLEVDSTSVREDIAVLPIDPCMEKTIGCSYSSEPMTVSDIANANMSSEPMSVSNSIIHWDPHDGNDEILYRIPKTKSEKSPNGKQQKRVSFHELSTDLPSESDHLDEYINSKETETISSSFRVSTSNLSRAVGDISSFGCEQEGVEIGKDSSLLGSEVTEELFGNSLHSKQKSSDNAIRCDHAFSSVKSVILGQIHHKINNRSPVAERGIPEGQEDPPRRCSVAAVTSGHLFNSNSERIRISNSSSPAPSCSSLRPHVSSPRRMHNDTNTSSVVLTNASVLSQTPSKACLVNRFLRSITEKKIYNSRTTAALTALNKKKSSIRKLNLYIEGVKPTDALSDEIIEELEREIEVFTLQSKQKVPFINHLHVESTSDIHQLMLSKLDLSSNENILKILKVRASSTDTGGTGRPLLAIVTNQAIHVIDKKIVRHSSLCLSDISTVLIGPNSQWVSIISSEKLSHIDFLVSGNDDVSELVCSMEMVLRRRVKTAQSLPAVVHLSNEVFMVPQWRSILQGEEVHNYSIVHALEETPSPPCSPSGPNLKAHFMFRTHGNDTFSSWAPGFFSLRSGVLHVSGDEEVSPLYSINLHGIKCCPVSLPSRPHTIEVDFLHIAAPDDYVASDWLAALQKSSSGIYDHGGQDQKLNIVYGSLLLTENHLILVNSFGIPNCDLDKLSKPLLSAFVSDITSIQVGDSHSCWCIVEFSCREVHESSGDYLVFFSKYDNKLSFLHSLWKLSSSIKENTKYLSEEEPFRLHCDMIAANLSAQWNLTSL